MPPGRFRLRFTYEENGAMRVCRQVLFQHDLFTSASTMLAFVESLGDLKDVLGDIDPAKCDFAKEFGFYVPGHQFKGRKQAITKDEDLAVMNGLYESCSARSSVYLFYRLTKVNRNFTGRRSMPIASQVVPSRTEAVATSSTQSSTSVDVPAPAAPRIELKTQPLAKPKRRQEEASPIKRVGVEQVQSFQTVSLGQNDSQLEPAKKRLFTSPVGVGNTTPGQHVVIADVGDDGLLALKAAPSPVAHIKQKMEVRGALLNQLKMIQEMTGGEVAAPSTVFRKAAEGVMEDLQELEKLSATPGRSSETMATQSTVNELEDPLGSVVVVQTGNEDGSFY